MLLSIIVAVLLLFLALAAVVLFAPIAVSGSATFASGKAQGLVRLSWLHPRVVRCILDIRKGTWEVFAFGMRINTRGKTAAAVSEEKKTAEGSTESADLAHTPHAAHADVVPAAKPGPQPSKEEKAAPEKSSVETRTKETTPWMVRVRQLWVFIGDASFRGKVLRWVLGTLRLLLRTCSVARVRVSVKAGFDDPARTGLLYGWYQGVTRILTAPGAQRVEIECEPVFTKSTFAANAEAKLATSVARLCLPIIIAVVTFPYLHAYVLYRRARAMKPFFPCFSKKIL